MPQIVKPFPETDPSFFAALEATKPKPKRSEVSKAASAFVEETKGLGAGALALGTQALQSALPDQVEPVALETAKQNWLKTYAQQMKAAHTGELAPKVARLEDIRVSEPGGFGRAVDWATYQGTKGLLNFATMVGPGGVAAVGARALAPTAIKSAARGLLRREVEKQIEKSAITGVEAEAQRAAAKAIEKNAVEQLNRRTARAGYGAGFATTAAQEGGDSFASNVQEGVKPENALAPALTVAAINGAIELAPWGIAAKHLGLGKQVAKGIGAEIRADAELSKKAIRLAKMAKAAKAVGKGAAAGAAAEGLDEGLQELVQIAGERWAKKQPVLAELGPQGWSRIANAAAAGALVGGVAGGAIGPFENAAATETKETNAESPTRTEPPKLSPQAQQELQQLIGKAQEPPPVAEHAISPLASGVADGIQQGPLETGLVTAQTPETAKAGGEAISEENASIAPRRVPAEPISTPMGARGPVSLGATEQELARPQKETTYAEEASTQAAAIAAPVEERLVAPQAQRTETNTATEEAQATMPIMAEQPAAQKAFLSEAQNVVADAAIGKITPEVAIRTIQDKAEELSAPGLSRENLTAWIQATSDLHQKQQEEAAQTTKSTKPQQTSTVQTASTMQKPETSPSPQVPGTVISATEVPPVKQQSALPEKAAFLALPEVQAMQAKIAQGQVTPEQVATSLAEQLPNAPEPAQVLGWLQESAQPTQVAAPAQAVAAPAQPNTQTQSVFAAFQSPDAHEAKQQYQLGQISLPEATNKIASAATDAGQHVPSAVAIHTWLAAQPGTSEVNPSGASQTQQSVPATTPNISLPIPHVDTATVEVFAGGAIPAENLIDLVDKQTTADSNPAGTLAPIDWIKTNKALLPLLDESKQAALLQAQYDKQLLSAGDVAQSLVDAGIAGIPTGLEIPGLAKAFATIDGTTPPQPETATEEAQTSTEADTLVNILTDQASFSFADAMAAADAYANAHGETALHEVLQANADAKQTHAPTLAPWVDFPQYEEDLLAESPFNNVWADHERAEHRYGVLIVNPKTDQVLLRRVAGLAGYNVRTALKLVEKAGSLKAATQMPAPADVKALLQLWLDFPEQMEKDKAKIEETPSVFDQAGFQGYVWDFATGSPAKEDGLAVKQALNLVSEVGSVEAAIQTNPTSAKVRRVLRHWKGHPESVRFVEDMLAANPNLAQHRMEIDHPLVTAKRETQEEMGQDINVIGQVATGFYRGKWNEPDARASLFYVGVPKGVPTTPDAETAFTKWVTYKEAKALLAQNANEKGRARTLRTLDALFGHGEQKNGFLYKGNAKATARYYKQHFVKDFQGTTLAKFATTKDGNLKDFDKLTHLQRLTVAVAYQYKHSFPKLHKLALHAKIVGEVRKRRLAFEAWTKKVTGVKFGLGSSKSTKNGEIIYPVVKANASKTNKAFAPVDPTYVPSDHAKYTGRPIVIEAWHGSAYPEGLLGDKLQQQYLNTGAKAGDTGHGLFLSSKREVAETFGHAKLYEMYVALRKPLIYWGNKQGWHSGITEPIIEEAKQTGHDGVLFLDLHDNGGIAHQFVVFSTESLKTGELENTGYTHPTNINKSLVPSKQPLHPMEVEDAERVLEDAFGAKWLADAKAKKALRLEVGEAPAKTMGEFDQANGQMTLYLANIETPQELLGTLVHEARHASLNEMLGTSIRAHYKTFVWESQRKGALAHDAAEQTAWAGAEQFGIENTLAESRGKARDAEVARVRKLIAQADPAFLVQEDLANYLQAAYLADAQTPLMRRIIAAIKAWWETSKAGQWLRDKGLGFELTDELAAALARRSVDASLRTRTSGQGRLYKAIIHHATPHKWKPISGFPYGKFDLSKVGTGEGYTNFGWGAYFADAEEAALAYLHSIGNQHGASNAYLRQMDLPESALLRLIEWDRPLTEQHPLVQRAILNPKDGFLLLRMAREARNITTPYPSIYAHPNTKGTGGSFYKALYQHFQQSEHISAEKAKKRASLYLRDQGIVGTHYLDSHSRMAGEGTYMYAIWDQEVLDSLVHTKLMEKNFQTGEISNIVAPNAEHVPLPIKVDPTGFGYLAEDARPPLKRTPEQTLRALETQFGSGIRTLLDRGLLEIRPGIDPQAPQMAAKWNGEKIVLYSGAASHPVDLLLHEASHARMADMLGPRFATLARAVEVATTDTARAARLKAAEVASRVAELGTPEWQQIYDEEKIAYHVQYASANLRGNQGLFNRIISQIRTWFWQTSFGQWLSSKGVRLTLSDGMIVELAKRALARVPDAPTKTLMDLEFRAEDGTPDLLVLATGGQSALARELGLARGKYQVEEQNTLTTDEIDHPDMSWWERARYRAQDMMIGIKEKSPEVYDLYDLLMSRRATSTQDFHRAYRDRIIRLYNQTGLTQAQVDEYLHARHVYLDDVNRKLAERAALKFSKDLAKNLPKDKAKALEKEVQTVFKLAKEDELTDAEVRTSIKGLVDVYAKYEMPNEDGIREVAERWENFKAFAAGMQKKGPPRKDGIKVAEDILNTPQYANNAPLAKLVRVVDEMNHEILRIRAEAGIDTEEQQAAMLAEYPHYVTLRREGFEEASFGKTANVSGANTARVFRVRVGTDNFDRAVVHVLANTIAKADQSLRSAERNISHKQFARIIKANPKAWKGWFTVETKEKIARHDKYGFTHEQDVSQPNADDIVFFDKGRRVLIHPEATNQKAKSVAAALNGLESPQIGGIAKLANYVNNWIRVTNVTASPFFWLTNTPRDFLTAQFNLRASEARSFIGAINREYFSMFRTLYRYFVTGELQAQLDPGYTGPVSEGARLIQRFRKSGGQISWAESTREMVEGMDSLKNLAEKQKRLDRYGPTRVLNWVENMNIMLENTIRLAAFNVLTRRTEQGGAGLSDERAARIAKDLTTNFTRRGTATTALNTYSLFFNASVQGVAQIFINWHASAAIRKAIGATIVFSFLVDQLNRALSPPDDDGDKKYNKLETYIKSNNLVFFNPLDPDKWITVPAPWGYNAVWRAGQLLSEMVSNWAGDNPNWSPGRMLHDLIGTSFNSFSPIQAGSVVQAISPTALDPLMMVLEGKSWAGTPLWPEGMGGQPRVDAYAKWGSTRQWAAGLAAWLNEATGGNKKQPGTQIAGLDLRELGIQFDVHPAVFEIIADTLGGAVGRGAEQLFAAAGFEWAKPTLPDEKTEWPNQIPFLRQVFHTPTAALDTHLYHDRIARVLSAERALRLFMEGPDRNPLKAAEVRKEQGTLLRLAPQAKRTERQIKRLRKQMRLAESHGQMARAQALNEQIKRAYQRFNRIWNARAG